MSGLSCARAAEASRQPFVRCTSGGVATSCLDTSTSVCPHRAERPAILVPFDCHVPFAMSNKRKGTFLPSLAAAAARDGADLVIMLPKPRLQRSRFPTEARNKLRSLGFTFVETDWVLPPNLSTSVARAARSPGGGAGCCGARSFHKLHAFGLEQYDAVAMVDSDLVVVPNASLRPLFDCAASGYAMSARGTGSGSNAGLVVLRPSLAFKHNLLALLASSTVSDEAGWNGAGWGPL